MSTLLNNACEATQQADALQGQRTLWKQPPADFQTVSADAKVSIEGWFGMGVVGRNTECSAKFVAVQRVNRRVTPLQVEA